MPTEVVVSGTGDSYHRIDPHSENPTAECWVGISNPIKIYHYRAEGLGYEKCGICEWANTRLSEGGVG